MIKLLDYEFSLRASLKSDNVTPRKIFYFQIPQQNLMFIRNGIIFAAFLNASYKILANIASPFNYIGNLIGGLRLSAPTLNNLFIFAHVLKLMRYLKYIFADAPFDLSFTYFSGKLNDIEHG